MSLKDDKKSKIAVFFLFLVVIVFIGSCFYILNIFCECISQETIESLTSYWGIG